MRTSVDVHNYLLGRDVPHEMVPVRGRFRRADRIAEVLGLPTEQVGRVVLFEGKGALVAALVPSNRQPDRRKLADEAGADELAEAGPDRIADLTGFLREALPPVPMPARARIVVDEALARQEILYFHGGETRLMLKIRSADLIRASGAMVGSVTR